MNNHWLKLQQHTRTIIRSTWFQVVLLWLVSWLLLLSFLLAEFLKQANYLEVFLERLYFPAGVHAATALIIVGICYALKSPQRYAAKLCVAVFLCLMLVHYDTRLAQMSDAIEALLPLAPDSPADSMAVVSVVFLALLVVASYWMGRGIMALGKRYPNLKMQNLAAGVLVLVGFIFFSQASRALAIMPVIGAESKKGAAVTTVPAAPAKPSQKQPDIYYIVLDRYANSTVLRDQLAYDNSQFTSFLRDQQFTVKDNAYANYPYTSMSIASTMSASYHTGVSNEFKDEKVQSHTLYHEMARQSSVIKALKSQGYVYHNVGSVYNTSSKAPLADVEHMYELRLKLFGVQKTIRGIEQSTFTQSVFFRFAKVDGISWWPMTVDQRDYTTYTKTQLETLKELAAQPAGGRLIFAHILVPHPPYIFNSDGSISTRSGEDNVGKTMRRKYLDQVTFINGQMEQVIRTITTESKGQSVILLNADEGPYPNIMKESVDRDPTQSPLVTDGGMDNWSDAALQMKYGILQAVHIPRATNDDLAHLSSVNLFRIVLNRYSGYQLDYLPTCHFGLVVDGTAQYKQLDLTRRLTGQDTDFCTQELRAHR